MPVPPARRDDVVDLLHGVAVPDPYRWLEAGESLDTVEWVAAQNERTREALDARPDRVRWHERLVALMQLPTAGGCQVRGDRLFVLERPTGAQQFRLTLTAASRVDEAGAAGGAGAAADVVLIDPASAAVDAAAAIDWFEPSDDGRFVAYGMSEGGTENSVLRVLDVDAVTVLADEIPNCRAASVSWRPDGTGFWYTRYPENDEYQRTVWFHEVGADWHDDALVWDDLPTPETWASVEVSPDGTHLLLHAMVGWGNVEVHVAPLAAGEVTGEWRPIVKGSEAVTSLTFGGDGLVGVTTVDAPRGRAVTASLDAPEIDSWRTLVAEGSAVRTRFAISGDELLVAASDHGIDRIERYDVATGSMRGALDDLGVAGVVSLAGDRSRDAGGARAFFTISSFTQPTAIWRWDASDGLARWAPSVDDGAGQAVASTLAPLQVSWRQYPSLDGTPIGIFLIHRADVTPDASTPAILNGYGGFAITESPAWSPTIAAWCERGGLYAIAGLRGGYEEGEAWHHAGRRGNKQNVFDDFHAAGDWLVAQGLTSRARLAIAGGSNGGLLVGAALTQRPEAYRAVWCAVPLLDMIRFPQFLIARLWTDEYGDPDVAEEFAWLYAYSPYHHVQAGAQYPAVLFTTAEGDSRVDPCHARKMAALLQHEATGQDEHPILFFQEGRAGHGVGKPVSKRADEVADTLAFFSWQLGGPEPA
jgi:prolyl oligopeptidase